MADKVSKKRRSEIMSNIKSKDTSIELKVRQALFLRGYRYRENYKKLPGKPDIVFTKKHIAIFIHGCFWHGHDIGCRYSHNSQTRKEYWNNKINNNKRRDKENIDKLISDGWKVIVVWECAIQKKFDGIIDKIISEIEEG